jgi:hypothetical protein
MKLDPGMHIGLHLVFLGKTGVTEDHVGVPGARSKIKVGSRW